MRHLLYGLAVLAMCVSGLGIALLPRLAPNWIWFALGGALLSAVGAGGWVLAGATALDLPRPRAGWVLMASGLLGCLVNLLDWQAFPFLWAMGEAIIGALLIFPLFPKTSQSGKGYRPGPVQPPVSRRQ